MVHLTLEGWNLRSFAQIQYICLCTIKIQLFILFYIIVCIYPEVSILSEVVCIITCTYVANGFGSCICFVDENKQTEDDNDPKIFSALFPCRLNANGT